MGMKIERTADVLWVHSSRIRIVRYFWLPLVVSTRKGGRSSSEQVWTSLSWWPSDVTSKGICPGWVCPEGGGVGMCRGVDVIRGGYPEQCGLSHDACDVTYPSPTEWQTDACENVTLPRAVLIRSKLSVYSLNLMFSIAWVELSLQRRWNITKHTSWLECFLNFDTQTCSWFQLTSNVIKGTSTKENLHN